jgi:hypothetical protein
MKVRLAENAFFILSCVNYATCLSELGLLALDCNPLEGKDHICMMFFLYPHLHKRGLDAFDGGDESVLFLRCEIVTTDHSCEM